MTTMHNETLQSLVDIFSFFVAPRGWFEFFASGMFRQDLRYACQPIGLLRILQFNFIAKVLYIILHIMVWLFEFFAWIVLCSASRIQWIHNFFDNKLRIPWRDFFDEVIWSSLRVRQGANKKTKTFVENFEMWVTIPVWTLPARYP